MKAFVLKYDRILGLLFCLALSLQCAAAQVVQLTSTIETTFWDPKGPAINSKTWTTRCLVSTNKWQVEGDPFGGLRWPASTNLAGQFTRTVESKIGSPGMPVGKADLLSVPGKISWLAFCSGTVLNSNPKLLSLPDDLWKEYLPDSWQTSAKIRVFEDALGLPERLGLYDHDQPVLQYRATAVTNILGWSFPLEFYVAQYTPTGTSAWALCLTAKGRIDSISETP